MSKATLKTRRQELRRNLAGYGATSAQIEEAVGLLRRRQELQARGASPAELRDVTEKLEFAVLVARIGLDAARDQRYQEAQDRLQDDDRKYRPRYIDPVLRGAARAVGETARSVQRRKAITRWEHADGAA